MTPPAGPEWRRGALPLTHRPMVFERPLCVALDGFTLHAATRAGGLDEAGREALLKYIRRPAGAQERVTRGPDGLVRIALKKAFSDGTVAVDLDPLSLLSRLCAAVPAPRFHTVRYAGVLASASKVRSRLAPKRAAEPTFARCAEDLADVPRRSPYRPWAELLKRTFGLDVLACPRCQGRLRLLAMVTDPKSVTRYLCGLGEPTEAPATAPARGPPYWKRVEPNTPGALVDNGAAHGGPRRVGLLGALTNVGVAAGDGPDRKGSEQSVGREPPEHAPELRHAGQSRFHPSLKILPGLDPTWAPKSDSVRYLRDVVGVPRRGNLALSSFSAGSSGGPMWLDFCYSRRCDEELCPPWPLPPFAPRGHSLRHGSHVIFFGNSEYTRRRLFVRIVVG